MNGTLGFIRITALGAVCAIGLGMAPGAHANGYRHHGGWSDYGHNRSHFSVSINLANLLLANRYYHAPRYRSRDRYYDNSYDGYDNYGRDYRYYDRYPQYSIGYSYYGGGYERGHDRWGRDRGGWDGDRYGRHDGHRGHDNDNDRPDCDQNRTGCTSWSGGRWDQNRTDGRDANRTDRRHRHW